MVRGYADHFGLTADRARLEAEALQWAMSRGGALGPRRLAVHPGRRGAGREAFGVMRSGGGYRGSGGGKMISRKVMKDDASAGTVNSVS